MNQHTDPQAQNGTTPAATGAVQPWMTSAIQTFAEGLNTALDTSQTPQDAALIRRRLCSELRSTRPTAR